MLLEKLILFNSAGLEPLAIMIFLVSIDDKGFIEVDEYCQTKTKSIWAIGDAVRGPMLAHKASEEGIMVSERIAGENFQINYAHIPNVIYTHPEVAWVGKNEKELKSLEVDYKSGSFPFAASGRALASGESTGSVTIYADKQTDKILGIQVFGPSASEIMHQGLIAMDNEITSEKFSSTIFSHPTVSEALHESTLAMNQKAIHIQNRKKKNLKSFNSNNYTNSLYLRFEVKDKQGVLSSITNRLAKYKISVKRIIQTPDKKRNSATIVVITHKTSEKNARNCLSIFRKNRNILKFPTLIRLYN